MNISFILRNYTGLAIARLAERVPAVLNLLPNSRSPLKPFIATRLRSDRFSQVVERDIDGFRMRLHLRDNLQRNIYFGIFENEGIEWCRPLVRDGGTCVDVGANVGWYTLHFASWVGSTGRVIALEADSDVAARLRENCDLSHVVDRVEVLNCAASNTSGTLQFARSSAAGSGWGSAQLNENPLGEVVNVSGVTLDSTLAARSISEVDLLKIDVESHEFAVLEGAADSLRRKIFRSILIEWEGVGQTRNGKSIGDMTAIFQTAGYLPSAETVRLLEAFRLGSTNPLQVCVNLLYHRPDN